MMDSRHMRPLFGLVVVAVIAGSFFWMKGAYNQMVILDETVKTAWSQVENQYQRRADLVPNLVNTVKGYATHERDTLKAVLEARAKAAQTVVKADGLTPANVQAFQRSQGELGAALSRLLVTVERYPDLKASQGFRDLQAQLEGTENRIAVERKRFNDVAREYNMHVRSFPASVMAGLFGFQPKPYFTADAGAQKAPEVQF